MAEIRITSNGETAREIPDLDGFLTELEVAGNIRVRMVDDHGWIVVNPTTLAVLQLLATPTVVEASQL